MGDLFPATNEPAWLEVGYDADGWRRQGNSETALRCGMEAQGGGVWPPRSHEKVKERQIQLGWPSSGPKIFCTKFLS